MKTKVIRMNPQELDMEGIREAGEILRQGGLVAFPRDGIWTWRKRTGSAGIC